MNSDTPRCRTCRHWHSHRFDSDEKYAKCWLMSNSVSQTKVRMRMECHSFVLTPAMPVGSEGQIAVTEDFGCILHEERGDE